MAKRFTATDKWQDEWFASLPQDMKLVWLYLLDNCDHAGIWKRHIKLLQYHTGTLREQLEIESILGDRIVPFNDDKWFVPKFISFQYPSFSKTNKMPAIISVWNTLKKYGLNSYVTLIKPLHKSSGTLKDKDKDKDMDKDKDKSKDKDKEKKTLYGEFQNVKLTPPEHQKLKDKFGEEGTKDRIKNLSLYLASKGDKYKSHYATILNWARKEPQPPQEEKDICVVCKTEKWQTLINLEGGPTCGKCRPNNQE